MENKRIVFLYTEIAGYILSCISELLRHGNYEVTLVRWPLNKEAPFDFKFPEGLKVEDRTQFNDDALMSRVDSIDPHFIFCSGWVDKGYLKVCKKYRDRIPVVVGIDNQWEGNWRQRMASLLSFRMIKPYFNTAWVPGEKQREFAGKLGFPSNKIFTGFYSADTAHFFNYYNRFKAQKEQEFPRRFIYVGRYLSFKGVNELWDAFAELQLENPSDWELWCLGTGDLWEKRKEHDKIKHFGFVQPGEIENFIRDTGVFILPSTFEPWRVVIHEFAASGFPIICTNKVGAASRFVQDGKNGFMVSPANKESLKLAMKKMMQLSSEELNRMSVASHELANGLTPKVWVETLGSMLRC